jgi:ferric-dicitrate binding protein FerR (iron transport regulator)
MSQPVPIPPDLPEKIVRLLDGSITDEDFAQLDHELAVNETALAFYVDFVAAYMSLMELGHVVPTPIDAEKLTELLKPDLQQAGRPLDLHFDPETSDEERRRKIESYANRQLETFLEQQRREMGTVSRSRRAYDVSEALSQTGALVEEILRAGSRVVKTVAVGALVVVLVGLTWIGISSQRPVATVVESVDARWESPVREQIGLRPQRLHLQQGYARIQLRQGAELIVQAPSTIDLDTPNRIFLEAGWITAKVPLEARGFTVRTPLSTVVDYGTEFGLVVNKESSGEVHVFEGRVGLQSVGTNGSGTELLKGEAATIDDVGRVRGALTKDRTRLFARTLPSADSFGFPGKRLDLSDMVGGGNGAGTGVLGQGLDPSTGGLVETPMILDGLSAGFRPVPALLFIDGVFVPDGGAGPQTISSTGVTFDRFPDTVGVCRETITDGAVFHVRSFQPHRGILPGREGSDTPSFGLPANAGITFDLKRIRSAMPDVSIARFRSECGLSETVRDFGPAHAGPVTVRVWVLVDGRVCLDKTFTAAERGVQEIDIPLKSEDRFLTLATTQVGDYSLGWVLFAEPALELKL